MSNRKVGNAFESEFCEMLFQHGFWVHNLAQNQAGQPADVIAVRKNKAHLIDCKVCENDVFPFLRIEPNQHSAMSLWQECSNDGAWFALQLTDKSVWLIDFVTMRWLSLDQASINADDIMFYGLAFDDWVMWE